MWPGGIFRDRRCLSKTKINKAVIKPSISYANSSLLINSMHFDEKLSPDLHDVLATSGILEITEFDLFHIAYKRWFGKDAEDNAIEPFFKNYMFHEIVPFWVREFTRLVLQLDRDGALDPRAFGIQPKRFSKRMAARGLRMLLISILVVSTLIILAELAQQMTGLSCFFPPCY